MNQLVLMFLWKVLAGIALAQAGQADALPGPEVDPEVLGRVVPVFEPRGHSSPILALRISTDERRLITVGADETIQIWSTATGEQLDVMRLPGYGLEKGADTSLWNVAEISPDGNYVVIGGAQKSLPITDRLGLTKFILVNLKTRAVQRLQPLSQKVRGVSAFAFSPDGNNLAVAFSGARREINIYRNFNSLQPDSIRSRKRLRRESWAFESGLDHEIVCLSYSPDGNSLLMGGGGKTLVIWDLKHKDGPKLANKLEVEGSTTALRWSPDGSQFVRIWRSFADVGGIESRLPNGETQHRYPFTELTATNAKQIPGNVFFLSNSQVLFTGFDTVDASDFGGTAVRLDLKTGVSEKIFKIASGSVYLPLGDVSPSGKLAAISSNMGMDATVYALSTGAIKSHCGPMCPSPTAVGWSKKGVGLSLAWSERPVLGRLNTVAKDLEFAIDLNQLELAEEVKPADFDVHLAQFGGWSLQFLRPNAFEVRGGTGISNNFRGGNRVNSATLIPNGSGIPLVAWSSIDVVSRTSHISLRSVDGAGSNKRLFPNGLRSRDMAPSHDGKFLAVTTGTHRINVYATHGSSFPLFSFARINGEWVAWTPEGFYAASPGGERLIGWAVNHGPEKLVSFYSADHFASHFRRPDILKLAIEKGSVEEALKTLGTQVVEIEDLVPAVAELKLLEQSGDTVSVRGIASSSIADKPLLSLELMLDGRPLVETRGEPKSGANTEVTWNIRIPPGLHELKLQAKTSNGPSVSSPVIVQGPKTSLNKPVLYRICVGIDKYDQESLRLNAAVKDATEIYQALERHCVGSGNRYEVSGGALITDRDATCEKVLNVLKEIRVKAKRGDLVVLFFAGHGVKKKDQFYLVTREANLSEDLTSKSVSGEDLCQILSEIECPVLMLLDACHSAKAVKALSAFRPATDDLSRSLTETSVGVTVLAAAMSNEVANASSENGYFTAALLKALEVREGVPFDPYERALYTHHLYSVVFSEVRRASNGKQNPFLNSPWTCPPLIVRTVPGNENRK